MTIEALDRLIGTSLRAFAADAAGQAWSGKEHDWVSRYAFGYLLHCCAPDGPLRTPGQLAIEVGVPQPPGYASGAVRRDLVIWPEPGQCCWDAQGQPVHHPLTIVEWKVHRRGHRNPMVMQEREWLRRYTAWRAGTVAYAVAIKAGGRGHVLTASRFVDGDEHATWLQVSTDR